MIRTSVNRRFELLDRFGVLACFDQALDRLPLGGFGLWSSGLGLAGFLRHAGFQFKAGHR